MVRGHAGLDLRYELLHQRAGRLAAILKHITENVPQEGFLKALVGAIAATGEFAFRDMFYEFIARQAEPRVQAAVILMQRLAERNEPNIRR